MAFELVKIEWTKKGSLLGFEMRSLAIDAAAQVDALLDVLDEDDEDEATA